MRRGERPRGEVLRKTWLASRGDDDQPGGDERWAVPAGGLALRKITGLAAESFRRPPLLQPVGSTLAAAVRRATDAAGTPDAVAVARREQTGNRAAARRSRNRDGDLHRPLDLPHSDGRRKYPDRPDVFRTRRAVERARTAARPASGHSIRRAPANRDRARKPQSLRPPRSSDAAAR